MKNKGFAILFFLCLFQVTYSEIKTVSTYDQFKEAIKDGNTIILQNNITITEWTSKDFSNLTIDGNGYTIKMEIKENYQYNNKPLFNKITNCEFKNIKLIYPNQCEKINRGNSGSIYIGSLANESIGSIISGCIVNFNFHVIIPKEKGLTVYLGGLVGSATESTVIKHCILLSSSLKASFEHANFGTAIIGGISGYTQKSTLENNIISEFDSSNDSDKGNSNNNNTSSNPVTPPYNDNGNSTGNNNVLEGEDSLDKDEIKDIIIESNLTIDLSNCANAQNIEITDTEIILKGNFDKKVLLNNNSNKNLTILCKADIYCSNNKVKQLTIGENVKLAGVISCEGLILHDGCLISENQINNKGEILYYRTPQVWTKKINNKGDGNGWETISLPFDAILAIEDSQKELFAYGDPASGGRYSYWLREFKGVNTDGSLDFQYASAIKANTPYIISMPGNTWGSSISLENKTIVFKGQGTISGKSVAENTTFISNPLTKVSEVAGRFFLNSPAETSTMVGDNLPGNEFIAIQDSTSLPSFRATIEDNANNSANLSSRKIVFGSNTTTQLNLDPYDNKELAIHSFSGKIFIESECPDEIIIYQISGIPARKVRIETGTTIISDLEKGVYIIAGKKIVL